MMNKLLVIGLAALVIVAGFLFLFPTDGSDNQAIGGTATIFIQDEAGDVAKADFEMDGPSISEAAMLSVDKGIRRADFTLASWPGEGGSYPKYPMTDVKSGYKYWVWVECDITVTGNNIQGNALKSSDVSFSSYISGDSTKTILYGASVSSGTVFMNNVLKIGTTAINQGTVGKWCYKSVNGASPTALLGADLNNMCLSIGAHVTATDLNGETVQASASYIFQLDVTYAASGSISASITNINVGNNNALSMLDVDAMLNELELARAEA